MTNEDKLVALEEERKRVEERCSALCSRMLRASHAFEKELTKAARISKRIEALWAKIIGDEVEEPHDRPRGEKGRSRCPPQSTN